LARPQRTRSTPRRAGVAILALVAAGACARGGRPAPAAPGDRSPPLEDLTWQEAERALTADAVVVLPIGASAKEHGPHLRLSNDWILADRLRQQLARRARVVVAPIIGFSYYPAFVEYPGSVSLRLETARDLIVDVVHSLARHGPRRFYALNTGISTLRPLALAAEVLAREGILLRYTDLARALAPIIAQIAQQPGGSHADEIETSLMLHLAPGTVDMARARKDYTGDRPGPLTRDPSGPGVHSPTGTWGDPTLATAAKGARLTQALLDAMARDIDSLRTSPLPR
jgi:creatinine amidohydrolase